jgi:hypothetical protein
VRALRLLGLGLITASSVGLVRQAQAWASREPVAQAAQPKQEQNHLPLRFEPNRGQFGPEVRFLARGPGYGLYLTDSGATLALLGAERQVVTLRVVGGRAVAPVGLSPLPGHSNYLVGSDRSRWRESVEAFGRVEYESVLPGVDLVFYGTAGHELEYDLELAPGIDPKSIELEVGGAQALRVDACGDLVVQLASGHELVKRAPVVSQTDARGQRVTVSARYELRGAGRVGFVPDAYDTTRPLLIDPVLSFSSYLGGQPFDQLNAVAVDSAGNTYVAGYTTGVLYPTQSPMQPSFAGGGSDAVISKINPAGTGYVYATYIGGDGADQAYAVAADDAGNAYVAGVTYSSNFPTVGALQNMPGGGADGFVTKLSSNGTLVYSSYLGGSADDWVSGVAVNASGSAYLGGTTFSTNFPTLGAYQPVAKGQDAFVTRLSPAGSSLTFSTYLGGTGDEFGNAIALAGDQAIIVGSTGSGNFPTLSPFQATYGGGSRDAFVTKLDTSGSGLAFSTFLGGLAVDEASAVSVSGSAPVVAGMTTSTNFPTVAPGQATSGGGRDAFVTRFNGSGSGVTYSTYLGGSGEEWARGIAADASYSYVVGYTASANFPLAAPLVGQEAYGGGTFDGFFAAYSANGGKSYSAYLGGSGEDKALAVALRAGSAIHLVGATISPNFPNLTPLPSQNVARSSQDGFVVKSPLLDLKVAVPASPNSLPAWLAGFFLGLGLLRLKHGASNAAAPSV